MQYRLYMVLMFLVAAACAEAIAVIMVLLIVCRVAISPYGHSPRSLFFNKKITCFGFFYDMPSLYINMCLIFSLLLRHAACPCCAVALETIPLYASWCCSVAALVRGLYVSAALLLKAAA